jgi:hypothetical protein
VRRLSVSFTRVGHALLTRNEIERENRSNHKSQAIPV